MASRIGFLVGQARRYAAQNPDKVESGLDRVGDAVNRRTGGKHASSVTRARDVMGKALGTSRRGGPGTGTGTGTGGR